MTPHTVLIFAYHFPPDPEIGSARPYRFYKFLSRLGYSCHVITASPQPSPTPMEVTYVADPFASTSRKGFKWEVERAVRWCFLPGAVGLGWSCDAYQAALGIIAQKPASPITVISTFPPLGVHAAAWRLAKVKALPWIADFRDPLDTLQSKEPTALQKRFRKALERKLIRSADAVIANTDACQQNWQREEPDRAEKIHLLWNGFDPEARLKPAPLPIREYQVLTHTGMLYAGRRVGPILESLDRLIQNRVIASGKIRLRLVGEAETQTLGPAEVLERALSQGWLELTNATVSRDKARDLVQTSDFLLLIQQQSSTQVPGKLFEYLQMGRPILAFVAPDSPTERILAKSGVPYRCLYPNDSGERMDQVMTEFLALPTTITPANAWFEEQFNGETQTRALAAIIDKTTTHRRGKQS